VKSRAGVEFNASQDTLYSHLEVGGSLHSQSLDW